MSLARVFVSSLCLVALLTRSSPGGDAPASEQPPVSKLTLVPASQPAAVFKYQLTPPFLDQTSGNAAISYYRALVLLNGVTNDPPKKPGDRQEQLAKWLEMPIEEMPQKEVREALRPFQHVLAEIRVGARRDHCNWDVSIRGNENIIEFLLPEMQQMRGLARILAVRTRLEMLDGKFAEALDSLQTSFAMSRHVADMPFLISGLVGVAMSNVAYDRIQEWSQLPGAPNMYWPLTALPRPLIDFEVAMQVEMVTPYQVFPILRSPERAERTPEQWNALLDQVHKKLAQLDENAAWDARLNKQPLVLDDFPDVRRRLEQTGYSPAEIDRMPVARAIAIDTSHTFDGLRDELFKWFHVPFWQSREGVARALASLKDGPHKEIIPLATLLLPAVDQVNLAVHRSARRNAELRVIEALRLFAAGHAGKLPDRLTDVKDVPLPVDPLTGRDFSYRREGAGAVIELELPAGLSAQKYGRRYDISIRTEKLDERP